MREIENTKTALILRTGGIQAAISEYNGVTEFGVEYDGIPQDDARALIAEYDRVQGALPELPPGYTVEKNDDGEGWFAWSPCSPLDLLGGDLVETRDAAIACCWENFTETLDPKWAQLLRNAGLPV